MPNVSVIIPAFNRAAVIGQTLQSVREQTFTDWECIVVDDGSTDQTPQVVEAFATRDPRFRLIRQPNAGAAVARNRGASEAAGEFLAFLDDDDCFVPDKLAWQVAAMRANPDAAIVYGDTFQFTGEDPWSDKGGGLYLSYVDPKPQGPPPEGFHQLLSCSAIYAPLVRASVFHQSGGFDTSLPSGEDWDMWLTLSRLGRLVHEPRVALRYRLHAGNKSGNTLRNYRCARQIARKHLQQVPPRLRREISAAVRARFRRGYVPKLLFEADRVTMRGDWPQARQLWHALIRLQPSLMLQKGHVLINGLLSLLPLRRRPGAWRWKHLPSRSGEKAVP